MQISKSSNQQTQNAVNRRVRAPARIRPEIGTSKSSISNFQFPLLLASLLAVFTTVAADYSIDWHTLDGGGGTSTGGVYSVSGTIGQPEAGALSGGQFTLQGGFWGIVTAVQTPGAPLLSVINLGNHVRVSWPVPADGWSLERTNLLNGAASPWPQVPLPYQTNGSVISVTIPNSPPAGNWFFRLHKP